MDSNHRPHAYQACALTGWAISPRIFATSPTFAFLVAYPFLFSYLSGILLLSHIVSNIVPSAAYALTVVFGMDTGVSHKRIDTGIFLPHYHPTKDSTVSKTLTSSLFPRKEVIQPHLPIRLPCYDFTPVIRPAFGSSFPLRFGHWLRALLTPMVWRAVCTRPGNVFTATFWFAITSDSSFM